MIGEGKINGKALEGAAKAPYLVDRNISMLYDVCALRISASHNKLSSKRGTSKTEQTFNTSRVNLLLLRPI